MKNTKSTSTEYLYALERELYRPIKVFSNILSDDDRLKAIRSMKKYIIADDYTREFCYAITLFDTYISLLIEEIPFVRALFICYGALIVSYKILFPRLSIDSIYSEETDYVNGEITKEALNIVRKLNGELIRPSPLFFLPTNSDGEVNFNVKVLILISFYDPRISLYKPSLIANAAWYMCGNELKEDEEISERLCEEMYANLIANKDRKEITKLSNYLIKLINRKCPTKLSLHEETSSYVPKNEYSDIYKVEKIYGKGAYGEVQKIKYGSSNHPVELAMKMILASENYDFAYIIELACLRLLSAASSECIISFQGVKIANAREAFLFLEVGEYNLSDAVMNTNLLKTFNLAIPHILNITKAIKVCHDHDIVHGDLKPENVIYIKSENRFKLGDFGSSIPFASGLAKARSVSGTVGYLSPEVWLGWERVNPKADIWSLGALMFFVSSNGGRLFNQKALHDEKLFLVRLVALFGPPQKNWGNTKRWQAGIKNHTKIKTSNYIRHHAKDPRWITMIMMCLNMSSFDRPTSTSLVECIESVFI